MSDTGIEGFISLLRRKDLGETRQGSIAVETHVVSTPEEAMKALKNHGGQGWICLANRREVARFSDTAALSENEDDWIECCEASHDSSSISISADGRGGWNIVISVENPTGEGIIVHQKLLASDGKGSLAYDVNWSPAPMGHCDLTELRPSSWRFTGFEDACGEES